MKVHSVSSYEEMETILHNNVFQNIGKAFQNNFMLTIITIMLISYMHFFKDFQSIFYLNTLKSMVICTYNIPDDLLKMKQGIGYYLDYIFFEKKKKQLNMLLYLI